MRPFGTIIDIVPLFVPVDMQTAANDSDWISLRNCEGIAVVVYKAVGTAGQDPVLTFNQATDVAGTSSKVLAAVASHHYKQGTLITAPSSTWTRVTQTASQTLTLNDVSAETQGMYVVEIDAAQLDIANGFDCIQVSVADVGGNAQLGCAFGILYGIRFKATPANLVSSIID